MQPDLAVATEAYAEIESKFHFSNIKYTSLEKFESLYLPGLGPQNYEWYQFQLLKKAVILQQQFGEQGLIKLRDFLVKTKVHSTEKMSDQELKNIAIKYLGPKMTKILFEWSYNQY